MRKTRKENGISKIQTFEIRGGCSRLSVPKILERHVLALISQLKLKGYHVYLF
jgi:hypothetical protein